MSAETDAVESHCGILMVTLLRQRMHAMYVLLFYLPSALINDSISPTAVDVSAAPILKLCDA